MLGIFFAQALHRMRRYFAAFLFEAVRLALVASMRAYHRGLSNKHLLYDTMRYPPLCTTSPSLSPSARG
jgi:hypothetical protein